MTAQDGFTLRAGAVPDSRACFSVFRASLHDLMRRTGYSSEPGDDAERMWPHYEAFFAHLAAGPGEWWIAEDGDGRPLGYARSLLRGTTAELTEFFVDPAARVGGLGRALLERAFPLGLGERRSIIATLDAPAVALYLRFGVSQQGTTAGFSAAPRAADPGRGLDFGDAVIDDVLAIEEQVLGEARPQDIAFIASTRPGVVARRGGRAVGYAFLPDAIGRVGPVAALDPGDVPALLAVVESAAHEQGVEEIGFTVPLSAHTAVDWLLRERRFRLDPFYALLLADGPWAKFDRYLPFNPCLIL